MGSGFTCEILNLSTGVVNLAGGIISTTGSTSVQSGQSAFIRGVTYSGGNVVYAIIPGSGQQGLGSQSTPSPGTVTDLAISTETSSSATVSWAAPISGGPVSAYIVQYRITGAANWNVASSSSSNALVHHRRTVGVYQLRLSGVSDRRRRPGSGDNHHGFNKRVGFGRIRQQREWEFRRQRFEQ